MWDLNFLTRDWTCATNMGNAGSSQLDLQESPNSDPSGKASWWCPEHHHPDHQSYILIKLLTTSPHLLLYSGLISTASVASFWRRDLRKVPACLSQAGSTELGVVLLDSFNQSCNVLLRKLVESPSVELFLNEAILISWDRLRGSWLKARKINLMA